MVGLNRSKAAFDSIQDLHIVVRPWHWHWVGFPFSEKGKPGRLSLGGRKVESWRDGWWWEDGHGWWRRHLVLVMAGDDE